MINLITEEIVRKEVYFLTKNSRYDYCVSLSENKLEINNKYVNLNTSDLCLSLDDFSKKIIQPLLFKQHDWNKAFKMETWI